MTDSARRDGRDVNPQLGLSRRDLLRRGAIAGGTLIWAAPTVQALAPKAFAQTVGTPPPDDDPPQGGQNISYLAFVLHNDGSARYKFEDQNGSCKLEQGGQIHNCAGALNSTQLTAWNNADQATANGRVTVDCTTSRTVWTIKPAANYGVLFAVVKSGSHNMCSVFDNNGAAGGYPKGAQIQVFQ